MVYWMLSLLLHSGAEKFSDSIELIAVCIIRCNPEHAHDLQRYPGWLCSLFWIPYLCLPTSIGCVPVQFDSRKIALSWGQIDRISLTHTLTFNPMWTLWSWCTHLQKFKVKGQSIPKMDGDDGITSLANVVSKKLDHGPCSSKQFNSLLLIITLQNADLFAEFFHCENQQ